MLFLVAISACALLATLVLAKFWIRVARKIGLEGKDMNKADKRLVPEAGGIAFIAGFSLAVMAFIFSITFVFKGDGNLLEIFAALTAMLLAGFIGFTDDILGWKIGLRKWQKPLLTIPIAIPLAVINAGDSFMELPFLGNTNLGILYPLLAIPIGIVGAANGFNMLAGYNGLEAALGIVIISALGYKAYATGFVWLAILAFAAAGALLGFLFYNRYPARVFPGDTLTYSVGAFIAVLAILGNMQKIAIILFLPFFAELLLKMRSRFRAENFGTPAKDGGLGMPQGKVSSVTHIILKLFPRLFGRNAKEYEVVGVLVIAELVLVTLAMFVVQS